MAISCRCGPPRPSGQGMTDTLLEWMSFRDFGRRSDLPDELLSGERPLRILSDLSALGHAEVQPDGAWRIAPPVLAVTENGKADACRAVLCGARTPKLLARLKAVSLRTSTICSEVPREGRPSIIAIDGSSRSDLAAAAAAAELPVQHDAAFTILACLPTIRDWPRNECPMVAGRVGGVKRFSRSRLAWLPSTLEEAVQAPRGLFRIRRDWDWINLLKLGIDSQAQIDYRAGRLAAAQRAKVVRWDAATQCLRLPGALYPPALIARALVLCSGDLPGFDRDSRELVFHSVPARITQMVLAITGLRLA